MRVVEDIATVRALLSEHRRRGESVGFVPTMGYLHEGHLSLVRIARARAMRVVVSIFVNPMQFGPDEDFERYPRDPERDRRLLEAEGCDLLFTPSREAVYPEGYGTEVSVAGLAGKLCGQSRPGHFDGVTTVVLKLFNIVQPDFAVFGQKDAQQLVIIRRMVADLDLPVQIVAGPTVREPDGLAASSRNAYLSPEERKQATCVYRALRGAEAVVRSGEVRADRLVDEMRRTIEAEPLASAEYISVVDPVSLEDLEAVGRSALLTLAVRVGKTRLIDNLLVGAGG